MKHPTLDNRYWGSVPRPATKAEFFNAVTTSAPTGDSSVATIRLYGPIDSYGGFWGISTKDVGQVLDALPDNVDQIVLRINSPGGEVFEAIAILNMLRAHKATVLAVVDGLAASAASVIASGCDETVMSPGTQMMIHSPSGITWGNASDLRKDADVLDSIEASLIEIYISKAGEKDWAALLADETWFTAAEATAIGLVDRVAVIPDAGEAATVGDDPVVVIPLEGDDVDDIAARARVTPIRERAAALAQQPLDRTPTPKLPVSTEPGEPNRKENAVAYSDLTAGLRERLGVTDADASDEQLLAAVDEALAEQASDTHTAPEGTVLMDAAAFADLRSAAEDGRQARAEQARTRRETILARAVEEGRIAPASRDTWLAALVNNEDGTTALLASLAPNTVPVAALGHAAEPTEDDSLYASAWGTEKEA